MAGNNWNGWKWLEIAGMAGNGQEWLKMDGIAGNGWNGWKWLEMAENSRKLLEIAEKCWND